MRLGPGCIELESEPRCNLNLTRRVEGGKVTLHPTGARIIPSLHVQHVESVHIKAQIHLFIDGKYLINREVLSVVKRTSDPSFPKVIGCSRPTRLVVTICRAAGVGDGRLASVS